MIIFKVADFGLASTDGANIDSGKLPIKWTAPEVGFFLRARLLYESVCPLLTPYEVTKGSKCFFIVFFFIQTQQ